MTDNFLSCPFCGHKTPVTVTEVHIDRKDGQFTESDRKVSATCEPCNVTVKKRTGEDRQDLK